MHISVGATETLRKTGVQDMFVLCTEAELRRWEYNWTPNYECSIVGPSLKWLQFSELLRLHIQPGHLTNHDTCFCPWVWLNSVFSFYPQLSCTNSTSGLLRTRHCLPPPSPGGRPPVSSALSTPPSRAPLLPHCRTKDCNTVSIYHMKFILKHVSTCICIPYHVAVLMGTDGRVWQWFC